MASARPSRWNVPSAAVRTTAAAPAGIRSTLPPAHLLMASSVSAWTGTPATPRPFGPSTRPDIERPAGSLTTISAAAAATCSTVAGPRASANPSLARAWDTRIVPSPRSGRFSNRAAPSTTSRPVEEDESPEGELQENSARAPGTGAPCGSRTRTTRVRLGSPFAEAASVRTTSVRPASAVVPVVSGRGYDAVARSSCGPSPSPRTRNVPSAPVVTSLSGGVHWTRTPAAGVPSEDSDATGDVEARGEPDHGLRAGGRDVDPRARAETIGPCIQVDPDRAHGGDQGLPVRARDPLVGRREVAARELADHRSPGDRYPVFVVQHGHGERVPRTEVKLDRGYRLPF